jgi:hypothetical protein
MNNCCNFNKKVLICAVWFAGEVSKKTVLYNLARTITVRMQIV